MDSYRLARRVFRARTRKSRWPRQASDQGRGRAGAKGRGRCFVAPPASIKGQRPFDVKQRGGRFADERGLACRGAKTCRVKYAAGVVASMSCRRRGKIVNRSGRFADADRINQRSIRGRGPCGAGDETLQDQHIKDKQRHRCSSVMHRP